jgi:chromosome segregation ATPase
MDYRKKNIADLENKKQESLRSLDLIREDLGRRLLERIGEGDFPSGDAAEYRRLRQEAADSEASIKAIEEDSLRLQALDEDIEQKEEFLAARLKDLSALYRDLGKQTLADPQCGDLSAFYRQRTDTLIPKIESLEARLEELEAKDGANVFTWIGKSAQAVVIRSFLVKAQDDLERLYEAAGDQFSRPGTEGPKGKTGLLGDIENLRGQIGSLEGELEGLRGERRKTGLSFSAEGGPVKHIQSLEKHIGRIREELKTIYRRFGEEAGENKKRFASLLNGDDQQALEKIALLRKTLRDYEGEIEKQKASLAVDEQKGEIAKLEKAILEQRDRIAASEKTIAGYTQKIAEARERIAELETPSP